MQSLPTAAEQAEYLAFYAQQFGGEGLADFIRRTRPHEPPPRHLMPLISLFERAKEAGHPLRGGGRAPPVRACISMPPRAGKSTTVRSGIAWWLSRSPSDLCIYVSYNKDIAARDQGYKAREEVRGAGVRLSDNRAANDDWATTLGGGLRSCGMNSGITGRGATGICIVDDPYAGFEEGESSNEREHVWNKFWGDVMTRIEGWASVIVVHTRFHEDDLIGRLEREHKWETVSIEAIATKDDPLLGRKAGESFWPERHQYTIPELKIRQTANPHVFAAMYQQSPMGRGKVVFGNPARYTPGKVDFRGCYPVIGVDPAASMKTSADWSVAVLLAIRNPRDVMNSEAYVISVLRRQVEIPTFAAELLAFQRAHWNAPVAVESVGAFKAVPQLLRLSAPSLVVKELSTPHELQGDKFLRAQGAAAAWNAGRFFVPDNAPPWLEDYLGIMCKFTGVPGKDLNDDDVDATAHAWNYICGGPMPVKRGSVADDSRWR